MAEQFNLTVIGGGPGGYVSAIRAAQLGARVAIVEKDRLGGTCLNRGCIPTKALVKSIEVLHAAQHGAEFGIKIGSVAVDFAAIMDRKRRVTENLVTGIEGLMKANKIEVYRGAGSIARPDLVRVGGSDGTVQEIETRNIIIATGSVPAQIPIPGTNLPGVINSDQALELDHIPSSMVIVGGGVIGMEFAGIFHALGTKITVIEMLPMILPPIDEEIARRFYQGIRKEGVTIYVGAGVKEIKEGAGQLDVVFSTAKGEETVSAELVLMATGRFPYTEGLGLSDLGVTMNRRAVAVNDRLQTNIDNIYAIGDAIGGIMLAHVASYEGEIAVENALGHNRKPDYSAVPGCIFTFPEIASTGLTEKQIKDQGTPYTVSKFLFSANSRANTMGDPSGVVKMICEEESKKVLGVHILGPMATELIAEATLAVQMGATAKDLAHTIHAHPTLAEAMLEAALGQLDGSIHMRKL